MGMTQHMEEIDVTRPTLMKVALAAGVSRTTASYALRGIPGVSAETRASVLAAAQRLGYRPDPVAVALRTESPKVVGLIVKDEHHERNEDCPNWFWPEFLYGVIKGLTARGIVTACVSSRNLRPLCSMRLAAILRPGGSLNPPDLPESLQTIPDIVGEDSWVRPASPTVSHNLSDLVDLAVAHLAARGAQRIRLAVGPPEGLLTPGMSRIQEPMPDFLQRHGLQGFLACASAAELAATLTANNDDGVIVAGFDPNDVLREIRRTGWSVPKNIRVVAISEGIAEARTVPSLTTVRLMGAECGGVVASYVAELIEGAEPQVVELPFSLEIRAST